MIRFKPESVSWFRKYGLGSLWQELGIVIETATGFGGCRLLHRYLDLVLKNNGQLLITETLKKRE
jgi:hypothetical protein